MRYAIFADVHGNFTAFSAIVAALSPTGIDCWLNLGDLVGYGPEPEACIRLAQELQAVSLLGNHDYALLHPEGETAAAMRAEARITLDWTRRQLSNEALNYLGGLPRSRQFEGLLTAAHAGFDDGDADYWPYILDRQSALFQMYLQETLIGCFGHGHIPLAFAKTPEALQMEILHETQAHLDEANRYLWSPGSVGQSRDGDWRAAAMLFDSATCSARIVRAEYDVAHTQAAIRKLGWPESLASRLK